MMRSIFELRQGYVFKTVDDAFCVAFTSPSDALQAALEANCALFLETWGETPIRVRMGLHCGEAEEREGDYFGPPLNRAARLMSAGHGGQILLSRVILVIAASFEGMACISIIQQNPQRALQLTGAAAELRMIANVPASEARVRFIDQALAFARKTLGDDKANSAWNEGAALTLGEAVSYAQDRP